MGVAYGVLVLVEALDSALRHVLRDTEVTVPVTDASAGQSYAVDLRRRVLECRCVRRELKVQPHFRGPEFIEQVRREDVQPIPAAKLGWAASGRVEARQSGGIQGIVRRSQPTVVQVADAERISRTGCEIDAVGPLCFRLLSGGRQTVESGRGDVASGGATRPRADGQGFRTT